MPCRFRHILTVTSVAALLAAAAPPAFAQTAPSSSSKNSPRLLAGAGFGAMWDDETFLGRGVTLAGGAPVPIGNHLSAEAELAWGPRHRNSGYLEATSAPVTVSGRIAFLPFGPSVAVRPFLSAGWQWIHGRGHFTSRHLVMGPTGAPVEGPVERQDWLISRAGPEFGVGLEIGGLSRLTWRPELRVVGTPSDPNYTPGSIEPPILTIRGGVTMLWRTR